MVFGMYRIKGPEKSPVHEFNAFNRIFDILLFDYLTYDPLCNNTHLMKTLIKNQIIQMKVQKGYKNYPYFIKKSLFCSMKV